MVNVDILIGIDTGVNTGFAEYYASDGLLICDCKKIHKALFRVLELAQDNAKIHVVVEDARLARFWKNKDYARAQGAGSVKRDAKIWEEFLADLGKDYAVTFELRRPNKALTKLSAEAFKKITGYKKRVNEHARDAAMLIYNRKFTV